MNEGGEDKIVDFAQFKRKKEESKPVGKIIENAPPKELFSALSKMAKSLADGDPAKESKLERISDLAFLASFVNSPVGQEVLKFKKVTNTGTTAYKDFWARAEELSLDEIRGQLEGATLEQVGAHSTWYCVLASNFSDRVKGSLGL